MRGRVAPAAAAHRHIATVALHPDASGLPTGPQVDQFYGANEQQLRDHIWLHSQAVTSKS